MNKLDQRRIVNNIIEMLDAKAKKAIKENKLPKEWDGMEIAQMIADFATENAPDWNKHNMASRRKEYRNTRLIKGI
jgi:hypothetical protein